MTRARQLTSRSFLLPEHHLLGAILMVAAVLSGCAAPGEGEVVSLCPGAPAGIPVDPDGCPLYSDADAVPDYQDKCPHTATGIAVDANGCPRAGERIAIVTNINFDFNRSNVRGDVRERLARVIQLLKEMPGVDVQIVGYTDDVGSAQYNLALSLRRAEAVRDYVVSHGVDHGRLSVAGRGKTEPMVPNATPEGRAVNRRVEFVTQ